MVMNISSTYPAFVGTWKLISDTTLGAPAATITLSSIPTTWAEFRLIIFAEFDNNDDIILIFNQDTNVDYYWGSYDTSSGATTNGNNAYARFAVAQTIKQCADINIQNIASMSKKFWGSVGLGSNMQNAGICSGYWTDTTNNITRIDISGSQGHNYQAGTRVILMAM